MLPNLIIADGPNGYDSEAIEIYENFEDCKLRRNKVDPLHLSQMKSGLGLYFAVEVENDFSVDLSVPCCQATGVFKKPSSAPGGIPGPRFTATTAPYFPPRRDINKGTETYKLTVTPTAAGAIATSRDFDAKTHTLFYTESGSTCYVRFKDSNDQIAFLLVTSNGAFAEWHTGLPWGAGLTDGFSPDDQIFLVGYETIRGAITR